MAAFAGPTPLVAPDRPQGEEGLYVVINNAGRDCSVSLPSRAALVDLLAGQMLTGVLNGTTLELPPRGIAVVAPESLVSLVKEGVL